MGGPVHFRSLLHWELYNVVVVNNIPIEAHV